MSSDAVSAKADGDPWHAKPVPFLNFALAIFVLFGGILYNVGKSADQIEAQRNLTEQIRLASDRQNERMQAMVIQQAKEEAKMDVLIQLLKTDGKHP